MSVTTAGAMTVLTIIIAIAASRRRRLRERD